MASIYIHIPFCHSKCYYCGFHSVASLKDKSDMIKALTNEIQIQKKYLDNENIDSIYLGGGTPSIIDVSDINKIINKIKDIHSISDNAEITIEVNPEDITEKYLSGLRNIGINRLSIGIQCLFDDILLFINRRHSASKAIESVHLAKKVGFDNISIDLIYGIPGLDILKWKDTLNMIKELPITHLSAYCLSIDDNTVFEHRLRKGDFIPLSDEICEEQYHILTDWAKSNSFIHYEISNFCKENMHSRHNTAYWQQKKYVGIGPGAHSYNKSSRQWNCSNNKKYLDYINRNVLPIEIEDLTENDRFNEYIMTSLRTIWGIDINIVNNEFGIKYYKHLMESIIPHKTFIVENEHFISLTEEGMFISNEIISDLFV